MSSAASPRDSGAGGQTPPLEANETLRVYALRLKSPPLTWQRSGKNGMDTTSIFQVAPQASQNRDAPFEFHEICIMLTLLTICV
jgi:hypothetical protein